MRLRSLLAGAALAGSLGIGSIAMMAPSASAAETGNHIQCKNLEQCGNQPPKCNDSNGRYGLGNNSQQDSCGICHEITTPWEPNLAYVTNTTGETVTVTLTGKYYWIQTKNPQHYYPLTTTEVTLTPGESISVAWYPNTGPHSWCWTGREICVTSVNPCPCNTDPCGHVTLGNTLDGYSFGDQKGNYGGQKDNLCGIQLPQPCKPVTLPCWPVMRDPQPCKPVLRNDSWGGHGNRGHGLLSYIG